MPLGKRVADYPIPWADFNRQLHGTLRGASFGVATDILAFCGGFIIPFRVIVSMLLGAILSPIVGAMADAQASKRKWLAATAMGGGAACVAMALVPPRFVWVVTACFLFANLCLELSLTVYNGFLPEIASDEEMNRVSAAGMGWGYFGGGLALLFAMLLLDQ